MYIEILNKKYCCKSIEIYAIKEARSRGCNIITSTLEKKNVSRLFQEFEICPSGLMNQPKSLRIIHQSNKHMIAFNKIVNKQYFSDQIYTVILFNVLSHLSVVSRV